MSGDLTLSRRGILAGGAALGAALVVPFARSARAGAMPMLAAKQRETHPNDWMTSDAEVACPDPNCPSRFRITRLGMRRFSHAETTAVPVAGD